jgi:hypothetical protein
LTGLFRGAGLLVGGDRDSEALGEPALASLLRKGPHQHLAGAAPLGLEHRVQAPALDQLGMEVGDEEPVQVPEAAWDGVPRLALGCAGEELGGSAGGAGGQLDEAVIRVPSPGDAHLLRVEGKAVVSAAPDAALQDFSRGDFVEGRSSPHARAVYAPSQYVATRWS